VTTCLQKNPEDRYQTAHDIKLELQWIAADRSAPRSSIAALAFSRASWLAAAVAAAILLSAAAGMFIYHPAQTASSVRTVINPPEKTTLNLTGDGAGPPVLSPDGTSLAFAAPVRRQTGLGPSTELAGGACAPDNR